MPRKCTVCLDKKRSPRIDAALKQGSAVIDVAHMFNLVDETVRRHARVCLAIPGPGDLKRDRERVAAAAAKVVPLRPAQATAIVPVEEAEAVVVDIEPIRTPEQVTAQLEWTVAKAKSMHAEAERNKDWRLAKDAISVVVNALDKLARSAGNYSDGTTINVNPIDQKIVAVLQGMSTDELREYIRTTSQAPDALEGVCE